MAERKLDLRVLRPGVWALRTSRWSGELLLLFASLAMVGAWAVTPGNGHVYPFTSVRALRLEFDVMASKAAQRGPTPPHWLFVDVGEEDRRVLRGSVAQLEAVRTELRVLLGLVETTL